MTRRLAELDLSVRLDRDQQDHLLRRAGDRLLACQLALSGRTATVDRPPAIIILLEGMDAAGKGGAIRCLTAPLDPRHVRVVSYAEPTEEELARPYLWRFWRDVPPRGFMLVCDRSWYGRVLVERVEGLASAAEWGRAYGEIAQWERFLVDNDVVLVKFWLHISRREQRRRFERRAADPEKRWKLTEADWRARDRWDEYLAAAQEMIDRTGEPAAPWTLVPADDKPHARVQVVRSAAEAIAKALEVRGITPPPLRDIPPVLRE